MPKIFGTNILGILAATVAFYMVGFLWFGPLFGGMWMEATGITEEVAKARMDAMGPMFFVWGILISLVQVLGLAYILNHAGASKLMTCVKICAIVAVLLVLPVLGYNVLYENGSMLNLDLGIGHILVGYAVVGAILSFFRGKDAIGE